MSSCQTMALGLLPRDNGLRMVSKKGTNRSAEKGHLSQGAGSIDQSAQELL